MKNILLIMSDQQRNDFVGFAPDAQMQTPNIDRIAEGTAFLNCVSSNPICAPARTALLTGKYSHQIGTLAMSGDLSRQHPTYWRALQDAGYHTAAIGKLHFTQGWPWDRPRGQGHNYIDLRDEMMKYGLDELIEVSGKQLAYRDYCDYAGHLDRKGLLEVYRDHIEADNQAYEANFHAGNPYTPPAFPFDDEDYIDNYIGDRTVQWLENASTEKPFFLFASFCSPHLPFDPPQSELDKVPLEPFEGDEAANENQRETVRHLVRSYKAMINVIDDQVGRIFQTMEDRNLLEDTVIIYTSDHGEMLGDRLALGKKYPWRQSVLIPCAIRHPDHLDGRKIEPAMELTDLTATMLEIAGLDAQKELSLDWPAFNNIVPSRSLMSIVRNETDSVREFCFSEFSGKWQMIQSSDYKYIRRLDSKDPDAPHEELYALQADPENLHDLSGDPSMASVLQWHRNRRDHILNTTPAAQLRWAPVISQAESLL